MQGPYVRERIIISDLLDSERIELPESKVIFVEGNSDAPSMNSNHSGAQQQGAIGLSHTTSKKRELYWFKGIKVEVLDENDRPLPTAEFICHVNVDIDSGFRNQVFPTIETSGSERIVTLTQGQTDFELPPGFGVPVASDETWTFTFQAANRTSSVHRRLKQRCVVSFLKEGPATATIKPLTWYNPYISVVVDKNDVQPSDHKGMVDCLGVSHGTNAPNMVAGTDFSDSQGRRVSGHWTVPPGVHNYQTALIERDRALIDKDRIIHAVWTHVHPLCQSVSFTSCNDRGSKPLFKVNVTTKTSGGLEIRHIDDIVSAEGIQLPAAQNYKLEATYKNTTNSDQDSMIGLGIFVEDSKFVRPVWPVSEPIACAPSNSCAKSGDGLYCGIRPTTAALPAEPAKAKAYPMFDPKKDGPILSHPVQLELNTSAGPIHIELDPTLAPKHATQLFKLLTGGAYNGTPFYRCEPGFVLQTAVAEAKLAGKQNSLDGIRTQLRTLPLEASPRALHKKFVLSMAHETDDPNSAVSSFSIMLGDAPHLDQEYTVFGRVIADAATTRTLETIIQQFPKNHPWIVDTKVMPVDQRLSAL
jgi:cyclophilin family peptidyl-prolyl cis-trans isomerase